MVKPSPYFTFMKNSSHDAKNDEQKGNIYKVPTSEYSIVNGNKMVA